MSKTLNRNKATPPLKPGMQTPSSRGIRWSKKPNLLNITVPLICPQESVTTTKNWYAEMKTYWTLSQLKMPEVQTRYVEASHPGGLELKVSSG